MHTPSNAHRRSAVLVLCLLALCLACNRGKNQSNSASGGQSGAKRYQLKGKIVSVDKQAGTANVDNEPIPGFMDSMVMGYAIKPAARSINCSPGMRSRPMLWSKVRITGWKTLS